MDVFVLDSSWKTIGVIDSFESLIWTVRYDAASDFEMSVPRNHQTVNLLQLGNRLEIVGSEETMLIEKQEPDQNDGSKLLISGGSLETLLERRVHAVQEILPEFVDQILPILADKNFTNPTNNNRKIPGFRFDASLSHDAIYDKRYYEEDGGEFVIGTPIVDIAHVICDKFDLGYRIVRDRNNNDLVWWYFEGDDRSLGNADGNQVVLFSYDMDNIADNDFVESTENWRNVAYIVGDGVNGDRAEEWVGLHAPVGFERREIFVDKADLSRVKVAGKEGVSEAEFYPIATYRKWLRSAGLDELYQHPVARVYEAKVDMHRQLGYGKDFWIGDIVQFRNRDNQEFKARIVEWVRSYSAEGYDGYPTFKILED